MVLVCSCSMENGIFHPQKSIYIYGNSWIHATSHCWEMEKPWCSLSSTIISLPCRGNVQKLTLIFSRINQKPSISNNQPWLIFPNKWWPNIIHEDSRLRGGDPLQKSWFRGPPISPPIWRLLYIPSCTCFFMFLWHSQKWRKAGSVGWTTGQPTGPKNLSQPCPNYPTDPNCPTGQGEFAPGLHIHIDQRFGFAPSAEGAWEGLRSQTSQLLVLLALKKRDERVRRVWNPGCFKLCDNNV